jgi:cytochrome P450
MYPAIPMTDRKCTKSFKIPELELKIEPGTVISLPIYALHHDPEYFPDPERFNPERFSEENKHKIQPFTNIPFGVGPRNCIGKLNI